MATPRETRAYYRRQAVKQRRSRIPLRIRKIPSTLGVAANLDLPAARIDATLVGVSAFRENNQGGQIDVFVNGVFRVTLTAEPTRASVGTLNAGDLVNLRVTNGFQGVEVIRFYGSDDNEIAWTKINASA